MTSSGRWLLGCAVIGLFGAPARGETEVLLDNGPSENRVNLVILGDGYIAAEQTKLRNDATALLDGLFAETPYRTYANFFNATLVYTVSNESGADHPENDFYVDTALNATYSCSSGLVRVICVNNGLALSAAAAAVPMFDLVVVLVNDTVYGGSGGTVAVVSIHSDAVEILRHELGHTLGGLADEYQSPYPAYPACSVNADCFEPNVTLRTARSQIKWNHWIDTATPLPTPATAPYDDEVGLFEGARYLSSGIYRPMRSCLMRELEVPFCPVCNEAMVLSVYDRVYPIDSTTPAAGSVNVGASESKTFDVAFAQPVPDTTNFLWRVDGELVAEGSASYTFEAKDHPAGARVLELTLRDETGYVAKDSSELLVGKTTWTLHVAAGTCGNGVHEAGEDCDLGAAHNTGAYDGCASDCSLGPHCGDGITNGDEVCDDGFDADCSACGGGPEPGPGLGPGSGPGNGGTGDPRVAVVRPNRGCASTFGVGSAPWAPVAVLLAVSLCVVSARRRRKEDHRGSSR